MNTKVFVYGTLKRGEPNHGWFEKHESGKFKLVCEAKTVEQYPLIIATNYNIPFLLYSPGKFLFIVCFFSRKKGMRMLKCCLYCMKGGALRTGSV